MSYWLGFNQRALPSLKVNLFFTLVDFACILPVGFCWCFSFQRFIVRNSKPCKEILRFPMPSRQLQYPFFWFHSFFD